MKSILDIKDDNLRKTVKDLFCNGHDIIVLAKGENTLDYDIEGEDVVIIYNKAAQPGVSHG